MWICRLFLAVTGRSIHTYHTKGAEGGRVNGAVKSPAKKISQASSTNLTRSFTAYTLEEHPGMMVCHRLDSSCPRKMLHLLNLKLVSERYKTKNDSKWQSHCLFFDERPERVYSNS